MIVTERKKFTCESHVASIPRYPQRLSKEQVYSFGYPLMFLCKVFEEKNRELFRKGYVKGTVILTSGNEATMIGKALPFRPGKDFMSLQHRDLGSHITLGATPYSIMCQYLANENSPTHGREGNVHFGDIDKRRFPFMSHLGSMLSPAVGGVWGARHSGEDVFGLAVIGDGGTSTGDFHESLNFASVQKSPVLFLIENNHYAYSTPTKMQYNCEKLSDRAAAYGIPGKTIDGTDLWEVYNSVFDAMESMQETSLPYLLESMTLRLEGHAVYDKAEYVSAEERAQWMTREPVSRAREEMKSVCGMSEEEVALIEADIREDIEIILKKALESRRPDPKKLDWSVYAPTTKKILKPFAAKELRNQTAVNAALEYILTNEPKAFVCGQDVGVFGSAFKTCKGLIDKFGPKRVVDLPICESATVGFCIGASQAGMRPIMEFQFADFATEAVTQLGLNAGTWFYRSGKSVPLVFRFPCGGGITLGAFHSGEFDGLWTRFPGLKVFYPTTPQETFEALVAAYHDPNPCLVFEHKLLYGGKKGDVDFDGDVEKIYRTRKYLDGTDITVVATGAMVEAATLAISKSGYSAELWNPYILLPLRIDEIIESVKKTGRLLVIQESGETAGLGSNIIYKITKECFSALKCAPQLIAAPDMPVPFAKELEMFYMPGQETISAALVSMMGV